MSESAYVVRAFYARPVNAVPKNGRYGTPLDATYFACLDVHDLEVLLKQQEGHDDEETAVKWFLSCPVHAWQYHDLLGPAIQDIHDMLPGRGGPSQQDFRDYYIPLATLTLPKKDWSAFRDEGIPMISILQNYVNHFLLSGTCTQRLEALNQLRLRLRTEFGIKNGLNLREAEWRPYPVDNAACGRVSVHALRQAMTDSLDASGEQQVEDGGGSVGSSRSRKWLLRSSWLLKTAKKVARPSRNVLTPARSSASMKNSITSGKT